MIYIAHTGARRPTGGYKNPNYDPERAHKYYEEHKKLKGRKKYPEQTTVSPRYDKKPTNNEQNRRSESSKTPIYSSVNNKKPTSTSIPSARRAPETGPSRSSKTPKTPGAVERKIEGYTNWMNSIMEANAIRRAEEIARTARAVAGREWLRDTFQNPNLYSHNGRTIYAVERLASDPAVRQLIRQLTGK